MTTEINTQIALHMPVPASVVERAPFAEAGSAGGAVRSASGAPPSQSAPGSVPGVGGSESTPGSAPSEEYLYEVVKSLNELVRVVRRELQFTTDQEAQRTVIKVVDSETDEVIRQIPQEEILAVVRHLQESLQGGLFAGLV